MTKGVVNIHGKEYKTVALRVNEFRETHPLEDGWAIRTWLISNEDDRVVIQATISDKDDHVIASDFAEEVRGQGKINKTSCLENCSTSAIGRALAAAGYGGEEYCSADELINALDQQKELEEAPPKKPEKKQNNPRELMEEKLDILAAQHGEQDVMAWFTAFLKRSKYSEGKLSLHQIKNIPKLWMMYREEFKKEANRAYDAGFSEE